MAEQKWSRAGLEFYILQKSHPSVGADRTASAYSSPLFPSYQQELTGHAADGDQLAILYLCPDQDGRASRCISQVPASPVSFLTFYGQTHRGTPSHPLCDSLTLEKSTQLTEPLFPYW